MNTRHLSAAAALAIWLGSAAAASAQTSVARVGPTAQTAQRDQGPSAMFERVKTSPDSYEPYAISQAIKVGRMLYLSGQAGAGEDGKIVAGGFKAQGEQALANLRRVLEAGGSSLEDVVKVTIFVTDMSHFGEVVDLRRRYFTPPYPADTIAEVKALYDPAAMIEIEAVALVRDQGN